ncbi:MAG: hypothetical protein HY735_07380 [Verrucomicrobia bacterium]|nr:hypothetical protein [Verrucomicrobiota bacterium]
MNDRAFYKHGNQWVDSSLLDQAASPPRRVVEVGSAEFHRLVQRLSELNRQGCIALNGEILLNVDGETVLVR